MAYSVLKQLKEEALKCDLCFDVPGDQGEGDTNVFKQLKCSHTFCKECLHKMVKRTSSMRLREDWLEFRLRQSSNTMFSQITCPNCRVKTVFDGDVDKLQSAFQVTDVIDWINKKQVKEKGKTVDRQCPEHEVQMNFFCIDCHKHICGDCLKLTHDQKHTTLYIKTEAEPMRQAIRDMLNEIDSKLTCWKKAQKHNLHITEVLHSNATNAKLLLQKYKHHIMKSLESATGSLATSIESAQEMKLKQLKIEGIQLKTQITNIETKMLRSRRSLDKADNYDVFNEHVLIEKICKEFLAKEPPKVPPPSDQTQASLKFSPDFVALKRLRNDIPRIGTVHTRSDDETCIRVRNTHSEGVSSTVLESMENALKEAYTLDVRKLEQQEDRQQKIRFIVSHLKEVLGEKWNCIMGSFSWFNWPRKDKIKFGTFSINDSDFVSIFKNTGIQNVEGSNIKDQAKILHSSYDEETDAKVLECVQRTLENCNDIFTADTAFNIAQEFSTTMKTPWQCIIHTDAIIGLSRKHIQRMKSDTPSMVTVRVHGKDIWLLKMISF